jgi:hypothetical protein
VVVGHNPLTLPPQKSWRLLKTPTGTGIVPTYENMYNYEINPNDVNGTLAAESDGGVASGRSSQVRRGSVVNESSDPGRGAPQATPDSHVGHGLNQATAKDGYDRTSYRTLNLNTSTPSPKALEPSANAQTVGTPSTPGKSDVPRNGRKTNKNKRRFAQTNNRFLGDPVRFVKFYTIQSPNGADLTKLNLLKADRELFNLVGDLEKFNKDNNRNLFAEVKSDEQGQKLLTLKTLVNEPIEIVPHEQHNQSQGVITSDLLKEYSEDDIVDGLSHVGVKKAYRIKRKNDKGDLEPTTTLILTFNSCNPPNRIRIIAGLSERVRPYIPLPRRCFKCQKYGHSKIKCRSETEICARCSETCNDQHMSNSCRKAVKCFHCDLPHLITSNKCERFLMEKEIIAIKIKEHLSFRDARRKVLETYPRFNVSYARATQNSDSQQRNNNIPNTPQENFNTEYESEPHTTIVNNERPPAINTNIGARPKTTITNIPPKGNVSGPNTNPTVEDASVKTLYKDGTNEEEPEQMETYKSSPWKTPLSKISDNYKSPKPHRGNKRTSSESPARTSEQQKRSKPSNKEDRRKSSKADEPNRRKNTSNIPTISGAHRTSNRDLSKSIDNLNLISNIRGPPTYISDRTLSDVQRSKPESSTKDDSKSSYYSKSKWKQ